MNSTFQNQTSERYDDVTAQLRNYRLIGAVFPWCSVKKVFLRIPEKSQENTFPQTNFSLASNFIKKEAPTQVLSCEFGEILRTHFLQHLSDGCF